MAGRNINNLRYADDTTLMAESEEELKSLVMKVKEESEMVGLTQADPISPPKTAVSLIESPHCAPREGMRLGLAWGGCAP